MVSNIFYFHPYLGKIPILTNIFQRGWNHQLDEILQVFQVFVFLRRAMLFVSPVLMFQNFYENKYGNRNLDVHEGVEWVFIDIANIVSIITLFRW